MTLIYYATGSTIKFKMVKEFFNKNIPEIQLEQLDIEFFEEQVLNLELISISKAKQAYKIIKKPVLVDDLGAYFERYPGFPGALTKYVVQGLGLQGLYRLFDEGDKASMSLALTYLKSENDYNVITSEIKGHLIKPAGLKPIKNMTIQQLLVPEGHTKSLHELKDTPDYEKMHPRNLALQKFLEFYKKN